MIRIKCFVAGVCLTLFGGVAHAAFPDKPIRFVVPNEPGGTTDVLIRALVPSLMKSFGQPVVVENRPGASASIGSNYVARSEPDGYTLLVGSSATSSNSYVLKDLPFSPSDLTLVSRIAVTPYFLIVNAEVKAQNVEQLVKLAQAEPGKLTYASSGTGTSPHLSGARFASVVGVDLLHIPYKGTAPALNDVLAGRVDMMFVGLPSTLSHIRSGNLRALAVAADQRLNALPDVPTMAQAGVNGFEADSWFGVLAPKGTPISVKEKIAQALGAAVNDSKVKETLDTVGAIAITETPDEAQRFFEADLVFWKDVVAKFKDQLS